MRYLSFLVLLLVASSAAAQGPAFDPNCFKEAELIEYIRKNYRVIFKIDTVIMEGKTTLIREGNTPNVINLECCKPSPAFRQIKLKPGCVKFEHIAKTPYPPGTLVGWLDGKKRVSGVVLNSRPSIDVREEDEGRIKVLTIHVLPNNPNGTKPL